MRRDYVEPDDFEYEPTAHDEVLKRAQEHRAALAAAEAGTAAGREGVEA
jgi:NADH-quinone oxidoreductase subunit C